MLSQIFLRFVGGLSPLLLSMTVHALASVQTPVDSSLTVQPVTVQPIAAQPITIKPVIAQAIIVLPELVLADLSLQNPLATGVPTCPDKSACKILLNGVQIDGDSTIYTVKLSSSNNAGYYEVNDIKLSSSPVYAMFYPETGQVLIQSGTFVVDGASYKLLNQVLLHEAPSSRAGKDHLLFRFQQPSESLSLQVVDSLSLLPAQAVLQTQPINRFLQAAQQVQVIGELTISTDNTVVYSLGIRICPDNSSCDIVLRGLQIEGDSQVYDVKLIGISGGYYQLTEVAFSAIPVNATFHPATWEVSIELGDYLVDGQIYELHNHALVHEAPPDWNGGDHVFFRFKHPGE